MSRRRKRGAALPAVEPARDLTSVQLQQLRERLIAHADKLPANLYDALQELITQVQADVSGTRACIMHERWYAVRASVAQGKTRDEAFEDAATKLAGTPAACGPDMMKKDFLAVERAYRTWWPAMFHRDVDEIFSARIGGGAALKFWRDDGAG